MKLFIALFASLVLSAFLFSCNSKPAETKIATFKISGMTCAFGCAKTIENTLSKTTGVKKAVVDFDTKTANVNYDASIITTESIIKTVQKTGDGSTYKVYDLKK